MLRADRFAEITDTRPGHGETPAAHTSRRAARRTQVISGGRSQWRNRSHGAYRCARKAAGGGVAYTRTHFSLLPTSGTSRARCATRAAPLRKSRRLAEFATKRSGLNKKKRSERRLCARTGDFVEKEEPSIKAIGAGVPSTQYVCRVKAPTSSTYGMRGEQGN